MKIIYDQGVIEDDFLLGLISNSESVAGFKAYQNRDIKMDDGLLEALFIRKIKNPVELQLVINSLLTKNLDSEQLLTISSSHFHIVSDDNIQWTLDGEDGGYFDEVDLQCHKRVLPIICLNRCSSKNHIKHNFKRSYEISHSCVPLFNHIFIIM